MAMQSAKQGETTGWWERRGTPPLPQVQSSPTMPKSNDIIANAVSNPKHPFPHTSMTAGKQKKHRYERRKVKEYIKLAIGPNKQPN